MLRVHVLCGARKSRAPHNLDALLLWRDGACASACRSGGAASRGCSRYRGGATAGRRRCGPVITGRWGGLVLSRGSIGPSCPIRAALIGSTCGWLLLLLLRIVVGQ